MITRKLKIAALIASACLFSSAIQAQNEGATTRVSLGYGGDLLLPGGWTQLAKLGGKHALTFRTPSISARRPSQILCLNVGAASPVVLYEQGEDDLGVGVGQPMAWAPDRDDVYAWLGSNEQLVVIELPTGEARSVTAFPIASMGYKGQRGVAWSPPGKARSVLRLGEDRGVLTVLEKSTNKGWFQKPSFQYGIAIIRPGHDAVLRGSNEGWQDGDVWDWDASIVEEVAFVGKEHDGKQCIRVMSFAGEVVALIPNEGPEHWRALELSPSGDLLLVEDAGPVAGGREFRILDPRTGERVGDPVAGHSCAWSPDGNRIAYLDGWSLNILNIHSRRAIEAASVSPVNGDSGLPAYWEAPVWSPDGSCIAFNLGDGSFVQVLDFSQSRVLVLFVAGRGISWSPKALAFSQAISVGE